MSSWYLTCLMRGLQWPDWDQRCKLFAAPSDCSLWQDWWFLLNHFFISSNAGITIPGFLLEVWESLTVCVSGMGSNWFCIQSVLLSQTRGFPWGWCFPVYLGVSSALHKSAYFPQTFYCLFTEWGSRGKAVASLVLESLSEGGSWLRSKQMLCGNNYLRETWGGSARDNETPRDLGVSFPRSRGVSGLELELAAVVKIGFLFCFLLLPPPAQGPEQRLTFGARVMLPVQNLGCGGAALDTQIAELSCSPAWWVLSPWPVSSGARCCVTVLSPAEPHVDVNLMPLSSRRTRAGWVPRNHPAADSLEPTALWDPLPFHFCNQALLFHQKKLALFSVYLCGFQLCW